MKADTTKSVIVLGAGQLGLLLGKAAKKLNIPLQSLSLPDVWKIIDELHPDSDLITFEQEHADPELLTELSQRGFTSFPAWESFFLLRNKAQQKEFLTQHGIPTSPFIGPNSSAADRKKFLQANNGGVLKAGQGGYDGKGVWILNKDGSVKNTSEHSIDSLWGEITQPFLEALIPFDYEIAAVVCRSKNGKTVHYPTVQSLQKNGICFEVAYTQEFSASSIAKKAVAIAEKIAQATDYVGVLAVELFVRGDEIFVNEIAPRVHNSGHFTIDVCAGSQFENHLRAGLGLDLAPTQPTHPAALMVNLLWPPAEKEFAPLFTKLTCGPDWPETVKLHWYGKSEIRPWRKMGHFTIYGISLAHCRQQAQQILASRWA